MDYFQAYQKFSFLYSLFFLSDLAELREQITSVVFPSDRSYITRVNDVLDAQGDRKIDSKSPEGQKSSQENDTSLLRGAVLGGIVGVSVAVVAAIGAAWLRSLSSSNTSDTDASREDQDPRSSSPKTT